MRSCSYLRGLDAGPARAAGVLRDLVRRAHALPLLRRLGAPRLLAPLRVKSQGGKASGRIKHKRETVVDRRCAVNVTGRESRQLSLPAPPPSAVGDAAHGGPNTGLGAVRVLARRRGPVPPRRVGSPRRRMQLSITKREHCVLGCVLRNLLCSATVGYEQREQKKARSGHHTYCEHQPCGKM